MVGTWYGLRSIMEIPSYWKTLMFISIMTDTPMEDLLFFVMYPTKEAFRN